MCKNSKENRYAVILAGGGGTRLWPKSRNFRPKQFLVLTDDKTLLQNTFIRLVEFLPKENIFIITTKEYSEEVQKELTGLSKNNILIEPCPKNTAPAIALAVWQIAKINKNAIIGSFASDHLVRNQNKFLRVLETAYQVAEKSSDIVTIGIPPSKADDSLGYIHIGSQLGEVNKNPVFKVQRFLEKPDITLVKAFIASGEYFWNASYFIAKASTFIDAYNKYLPEITKTLWEILDKLDKNDEQKEKKWKSLKNIAVDYGIMEKAKNISMVAGDFDWSDIGSWSVLAEVFPSSDNGNVLLGNIENNHLMLESKNCLIYGNGKMIATIGISDLIIVESDDAILITAKSHAQKVKKLVEKLKSEGKNKYL